MFSGGGVRIANEGQVMEKNEKKRNENGGVDGRVVYTVGRSQRNRKGLWKGGKGGKKGSWGK